MKIIDHIKTGTFITMNGRTQRASQSKFPAWMIEVAQAESRSKQLEILDRLGKGKRMIEDHLTMELIRMRANKRS